MENVSTDIDRCVGARLKARREKLGLRLDDLAWRLGCEAAQLERYETGRARIGAATLLQLVQICGVDVGYFLAGLQAGAVPPARRPGS